VQLEKAAQSWMGLLYMWEIGCRSPFKKDTLEFYADFLKPKPDCHGGGCVKNYQRVERRIVMAKITETVRRKSGAGKKRSSFLVMTPKVATKSLPKDIISKIQITAN